MGATVTAVVVGLVAWQAAGPNTPRGIAATPAPLAITAPPTQLPAGQRLSELARRARTSDTPRPDGPGEYLEMRAWYLNSQVSGGHTVSEVVPEIHRMWLAADGSGRGEKERVESGFRWLIPGNGDESWTWPSGGRITAFGDNRPPATAEGMARHLYRPNPPDDIGPVKTLVALNDLLRERILTPVERAAALEMLAGLPDLTYQGMTEDRVGRPAEAFSLDSAYAGLPARYTLLISPENGVILGNEEMLTTTAGALNVTVPAVISYETYVRSEFQ